MAFYLTQQKGSDIFFSLMPKVQITIVPQEVGQLWDQILENVLNDVCSPPKEIPLAPIKNLIPHTYNPRYNLYQGQCHQQYTPNLCGYHATFNTLCFLNLIKRDQTNYNILSGSSFWRFKKRVQTFLFRIKKQYKLKEEWPWRDRDILYGDFERSYNKLCLQRFEDFQVFRNHDQFELYSFTWEFQYQNLLANEDKIKELNQLISYFKKYKKEKPLVISFMLAITNHWMCLNAVKIGNQTQYWFFDSFNRHILDLTQKEMLELTERLNEERIKYKKEPFSQFFKKNIPICFKDTQISLKLIIECLQEKNSIDQYIYNQAFNIFANELEKYWEKDSVRFATTVKEYWHNITSFMKRPIQRHLFTPANALRFNKFLEAVQITKGQSSDVRSLADIIRYYRIKSCM